jgi:hypothetical protein
MSLHPFDAQGALFSLPALSGQLFARDDRYRLFAQKIYPVLVAARPKLASAYCLDNGRPGIEPVLLAGVSLLQYIERVPDRQAAELLQYHAGWNFALGRQFGEPAFHFSVLSCFRERLLEHEQSATLFAQLLEALTQAGLVERNSRQRLDSTPVLGLVRHMNRLDCMRTALRLALQEVEPRIPEPQRPAWWQACWERYVQSKLDYKLQVEALKQKMEQSGQDARLLLEWLKSLADTTLAQGAQVQLLEKIFQEQFDLVAGQTPVSRNAQPTGAVINPHDPQAQWSAKGKGKDKKEWVGYKVQVAETVPPEKCAKGEPTRGFITAVEVQSAWASDQAGAEQVQASQSAMGLDKPSQLYVDGAYVTAEKLAEAAQEHRELIGPAARAAGKEGHFGVEDFAVEVEQRKAHCPAGKQNTQCSRIERGDGQVEYRFEWTTHCHQCPWRDKCLGSNQKHRTLEVGQYHSHLQARRKEQQTPEFEKQSHQRNAIEGTQSELVRQHGLRRARYRGLAKMALQGYFTGAACNAKRWIKRILWELQQAQKGAKLAVASG